MDGLTSDVCTFADLRSTMTRGKLAPMTRIALIYGSALAVGAFALRWLEYRYTVRVFPPEIHIVLVALLQILLVGLPIVLISAAILRNPRVLPAVAWRPPW